MTIQDLGYRNELADFGKKNDLDSFEIGRVNAQHKDRYSIKTSTDEFDAELIGNLRFTATDKFDLPAVGDWVAFNAYDDNKALIHAIYPRTSILQRQASGKKSEIQIIATNIDFGLIVQAVDRDFNLNRLERYLTICNASNVEPIIVLSKIDLLEKTELSDIENQIRKRVKNISIVLVSNEIDNGYAPLNKLIQKGKTYCLLGSSGVGKSTLTNTLAGRDLMKTGDISDRVNKGRHVTSHRELIILENGGILIDNPGLREIGITNMTEGLEITFDSIAEYAANCKYADCTHINEAGCAILEALQNNEIDAKGYANFQKMQREKEHYESSSAEKKQKDKNLGKMIRDVQKLRKKTKY